MISISVPLEDELSRIKELLRKENIELFNLNSILDNSMVISEDSNIVGYANYILLNEKHSNIGLIDKIIIKKEFRNQYLGDGLIKALLNLADSRGINTIYSISSIEESHFYKNVGFTKIDSLDESLISKIKEYTMLIEKDSIILEAKLPDFFQRACKSKQ